MLGAIAMKILAEIFPSAQRIALIGMINNKQAVPIQPKRRLAFARLSSEFLVLCMTSQFNQFQFLAGTAQRFVLPAPGWGRRSRPTGKMLRRKKLPEIAAESPVSGARFVRHVVIIRTTPNQRLNYQDV